MSKPQLPTGLKPLVDSIMQATEPALPPVEVSGEALHNLSVKMREWSGWPDAKVHLGVPVGSPFARCDMDTRTFTVNADALVLNPNRVLLTVTPFRLRQEAVLTGAMLHEAGHARHSHWMEHGAVHGDGTPASKQTVALARLMEEPRVEGLMVRDASEIGAPGLDWTMRASAAHLIPTTRLTLSNPGQQVMDLIDSWAKRAGRQIGFAQYKGTRLPGWVGQFGSLLHTSLVAHLSQFEDPLSGETDATAQALKVMSLLQDMILCTDNTGPTMLDTAREVLAILFPETDGDSDDAPMPGDPHDEPEQGDEGESAPSGSEQGDEDGDEEGTSAPSEDEQDSDEGEGQSPGDEPGDGEQDSQPEQGEGEGEQDSQPEPSEAEQALAKALADMEAAAASQTEDEAEAEQTSGGTGGEADLSGGFRHPSKDEREVQKKAEHFLRDLISPTESSKVSLTESPSAMIDGAALSAWRAGGASRDPRFFKRTRREVEPAPPVKIAVLVDVSASMEMMQHPSALLSWAVASAAFDMRNFAGRGQQIESTLIHWGSQARVIQRNGEMLPGIRSVPCNEGTSALHTAMDLVAEQIPGFFDFTDRPLNRLIVNFTDWELGWGCRDEVKDRVKQAMEVGINMINVVPSIREVERYSSYPGVMAAARIQRGVSTLVQYNRANPDLIWDEATKALG